MQARFRPGNVWEHLRSTYWFIPSLVTIACMVLAIVLGRLDRRAGELPPFLSWTYGGGPDGARALLSAVAGSMITVVSVTFSVTIVAVTVAAQHFGPRLLNNFIRDRAAQIVLGTFIGTFAYCLLVLRTVYGEGAGFDIFVPHLGVTGAVGLALASVGTLIYYVHHVSASMRVSSIALGVSRDLERTIERLYPERLGTSTELPPAHLPSPPPEALRVAAMESGYVDEIEGDAMMDVAREAGAVVWLQARPGDFVVEGTPLALVHPAPSDPADVGRRINGAVVLGSDRTPHQDVAFPVQQLVEVALHALSPGLNEPFTATTCIDRLAQGLYKLAQRRIPSAARADGDGVVRVIARPYQFGELLTLAFAPLRPYAARSSSVAIRILEVFTMLAQVAHRTEDQAAIQREARLLWEAASTTDVPGGADARIAEAYDRFTRR